MISKSFFRFLAVIPVLFLAIGCYPEWDGRSVEEILGMPAEDAVVEDLQNLSKDDITQLFLAADMPELSELEGEYKAELISPNLFTSVYSDYLMGPGLWEGKAFTALDENNGHGYNIFKSRWGNSILRTMEMDTYVDISRFDDKDSIHIVYDEYNKNLNKTMHDEVRKINDELFIGVGTVAWSGDKLNPMPFAIYGVPEPWIGADE